MKVPANSDQAEAISLLRQVLDMVLSDRRFFVQKSVSTIELAEHIQSRVAAGERDISRLRVSALKRLGFEA